MNIDLFDFNIGRWLMNEVIKKGKSSKRNINVAQNLSNRNSELGRPSELESFVLKYRKVNYISQKLM